MEKKLGLNRGLNTGPDTFVARDPKHQSYHLFMVSVSEWMVQQENIPRPLSRLWILEKKNLYYKSIDDFNWTTVLKNGRCQLHR